MSEFSDDDFLGETPAAPTPVPAAAPAAQAPAPQQNFAPADQGQQTQQAQQGAAPAPSGDAAAAPAPEKKISQRKSVYLNRFTLRAPALEGAERESEFFIEVNDGNVHLNVRNHLPEEKDMNWGRVKARVGLNVFIGWIEVALDFIATGQKGKMKMDNYSHYQGGKYTEQMGKENDLIWGCDDNGVYYITVHEQGRRAVRFDFKPTKWHHMVKGDGQPFSDAEISKFFFRGWLKSLRQVVGVVVGNGACASVFLNYDEAKEGPHGNSPDAAPPAGGGYGSSGQGGFQKRQWNGGGQGGGGGFQKRQWNNGGGGGNWNRGGQGGGGGGWQNRGGGGGGGNWQNRNNGGGGGGWQNRGQGGGGWNGGGGQGGQGGGGGDWKQRQQQKAVDGLASDDIQF